MSIRRAEEDSHSFLFGCFGLIILYSIMPIVSRLISSYLTTYFFMLVLVVTAVLVFFCRQGESFLACGSLLFPFAVWQLMSFAYNTDSALVWGYACLLNLIPVIIGFYICSYPVSKKAFVATVGIAFAVTCITTVVVLLIHPDAARWLATVADSQDENLVYLDMRNVGGYTFVYSAVLTYPAVIWAGKQEKIPLWLSLGLAILLGITVFLAGYTTALLLFMISSCLFFVKKDLRVADVWAILLLGIIAYFLFTTVFSDIFIRLASLTDNQSMAERLTALAGGYEGVKGSESNRIELYRYSFQTFLGRPLFGTLFSGGGRIGGHSFIFDSLGQYGLVGAIVLFFMYKKLYSFFFAPLRNVPGFGFFVWAFIQAIVLSCINTGAWLNVLALYIPIIALYFTEQEDSGNENLVDC